jgi:hypothetical protein
MNNTSILDFCMYCGQWRNMVWVHSHYHCTSCLNNAIPSCEGDELDTAAIPSKRKQLQSIAKFGKESGHLLLPESTL